MKVLHIAQWCSARVYKQVLCQQAAGWDVSLMAACTPHPDLHAMVRKQVGWSNGEAIAEISSGYDVCVVHTTVSTHGSAGMHLNSLRKVWDVHDYVDTKYADAYDAVTCPSAGIARKFDSMGYVVYSKVPKQLIPEWAGLQVYACVLNATVGNGQAWSDYRGLEERLGMPVFVYASAEKFEHEECYRVMKKLPYTKLLKAMTGFMCGYAGAANSSVNIDDCVTNKFWEYAAAGLSVILDGACAEMMMLADEYGLHNRGECDSYAISMESELNSMEVAYGI